MLRMSYSDHFSSVIRPLTFSNNFSSETPEPFLAQISYGASLGSENKRLLKGCGPLTKMAAMPIYGKNL